MNTLMAEKLISAGVVGALPSNKERIWAAVKAAMPNGLTHRQLVRQFTALPKGSISSTLCNLESRGMVYSKGTKGYGPTGKAKQYFTNLNHYELLPVPKSSSPAPKAPAPTPAPAPAHINGVPTKRLAAMSVDELLESINILQARELYIRLGQYFAG